VQCAVCCVQCAVCSVLCAVCCVLCAVHWHWPWLKVGLLEQGVIDETEILGMLPVNQSESFVRSVHHLEYHRRVHHSRYHFSNILKRRAFIYHKIDKYCWSRSWGNVSNVQYRHTNTVYVLYI
jgi:hypothetical protein